MKRFLAAILAAVMTLSGASFAFGAETLNIDCVVSNSYVEVGDTFYVDFKVNDNPTGYNSITTYLRYDPDVIRAVECGVDEIPSDLIVYLNDNGAYLSLFPFNFVNERISFKPKSGDRDYDGKANGKKTASEIGIVKLTSYLGASVNTFLQNYTDTGTLVRIKFEAVGGGSTDVELTNSTAMYFDNGANIDLNINADSGRVTVAGDPVVDNPTETPSEKPSETTTSSDNSSNNGSSSSGGGSGAGGGSGSGSATTTTEATTQATTSSAVDNKTEVTTSSVSSIKDFADVPKDAWYYEPIMKLANAKVVNGYAADNTFRPNNNVTRADFVLMLLRGMGVDTTQTPDSNFADVSSAKYYYNAVGIAKAMGIASGDGTNFNPESNITRQDMMILAKKALEISLDTTISGDTSVLDKFNDKADISAYAVDSLAAMVSEGIVNGMGDGIAPKANTTRAQAVVIISKIMDKL